LGPESLPASRESPRLAKKPVGSSRLFRFMGLKPKLDQRQISFEASHILICQTNACWTMRKHKKWSGYLQPECTNEINGQHDCKEQHGHHEYEVGPPISCFVILRIPIALPLFREIYTR
jgi:hypothetical protein